MIFVTVGTHEQQFNRLIEYMDRLKAEKMIDDEVIMQTGYSTYEPKYCKWKKMFPYSDMVKYVAEARMVITHGGPSSFIMPLQIGKIPIVVPRKKEFGEHVNDHQVEFCDAVSERMGNIIVVRDMSEMCKVLKGYDDIVKKSLLKMESNNEKFCRDLGKIVVELVGDK